MTEKTPEKPPEKPPEAKTITVVAKAKILHSGTLYAEGAEITDTPEILQSLIDSENAEIKKK